jgi:hypothetical protein
MLPCVPLARRILACSVPLAENTDQVVAAKCASSVTTAFHVETVATKVDNAVIGRRESLAPSRRPIGTLPTRCGARTGVLIYE